MAEASGEAGALVLVSILVVIFSFLKNGFIFAANYVLAKEIGSRRWIAALGVLACLAAFATQWCVCVET